MFETVKKLIMHFVLLNQKCYAIIALAAFSLKRSGYGRLLFKLVCSLTDPYQKVKNYVRI